MAATAHPVVPLSEAPAHLTGDESTAASLRGTDSSEKDLEKKGEEGMEREKEEEGGQEKEQEGQQEVTYPDGGVAAWMNVLGSFLVMFATFGFSNSFGVFQSYYQRNQFSEMTPSSISWLGSIQIFLQFSMGMVAGPLYDKGYFRVLLGGGSVLYIFCLFMVSLSTKYWHAILAQAFGMGIGMGLTFLPAISVLAQWFHRRRSIMMGIAVVGSSVGGVIFPIMLNRLFLSVGFAEGVRASAYLNLGCLLIANLIMKPRLPGRKKHVAPPSLLVIFSELRYTVAVAGAFFIALGMFFPYFYLQRFCELNGISQNLSFYSLTILNAASIFGRTIPNYFSDIYGPFTLLVPSIALTSVLMFSMLGATNPGGVIAFAILFGFGSGSYVSLISPVIISLSPNPQEIGIRTGLSFICVGFAALAGNPIAGALLVRANNAFYAPICFCGVSTMMGTGLMAYARYLQTKVKGTQWV